MSGSSCWCWSSCCVTGAGQTGQPRSGPHEPLPPGEHHVVRVVDGDTLLVDPHARVRLIGVNAPETVKPDWPVEPWGPEASAFTKQFVSGGTVRLEFDDEPVDAYDRYLAYVWVGDQMLNEALLRGRPGPLRTGISLFVGHEAPLPAGPGRSPAKALGHLERQRQHRDGPELQPLELGGEPGTGQRVAVSDAGA